MAVRRAVIGHAPRKLGEEPGEGSSLSLHEGNLVHLHAAPVIASRAAHTGESAARCGGLRFSANND
jgi:hypothetical protein